MTRRKALTVGVAGVTAGVLFAAGLTVGHATTSPTVPSGAQTTPLDQDTPSVRLVERVNALGDNSSDISVRACTARRRGPVATEAEQAAATRDRVVYHYGQAFGRAGTSETTTIKCLGDGPQSIVVGDFDQDRLPDIAMLRLSGAVDIAWNNGGGTFAFAPVPALSESNDLAHYEVWAGGSNGGLEGTAYDQLRAIAAVDANDDGNLDLVLLPSTLRTDMKVLTLDGTRNLPAVASEVATQGHPGVPESVSVEDVNNDGVGDILWAIRTHQATYDTEPVYAVRLMLSTAGKVPYFEERTELMPRNTGTDRPVLLTSGMRSDFQTIPTQPFSMAIADYDHDSDLDIYLGGEAAGSRYYRNDNGHWVDATETAGIDASSAGMGTRVMDVNNDGNWDVLSTENSYGTYRCPYSTAGCSSHALGNLLFLGDGNGSFKDAAEQFGVKHTGFAWGYSSSDLDADGYQDLFVGNGEVASEKAQDNWEGSFNKPYLLMGGPNGWTDRSGEVLRNLSMPGTSVVVGSADFDGDMRPDLLVVGRESSAPYLLLNRTEGGNVAMLEVQGSGAGHSPRHGESAQVRLWVPERPFQAFTVPGHQSNYHLLMTGTPIPLGLGEASSATVEVTFPSGVRVTRTIEAGKVNIVSEDDAMTGGQAKAP